jgi:phosphoglycerate dehydrogenase-like enzyme
MKVVFHYDAGPALAERLAGLAGEGLEVTVVPVADGAGFVQAMADCEVLWHVLEPVRAHHIAGAPSLRLIQKIGVGVNTIDLAAAEARGIAVCNMPGTNSQAVAEMTLLLMLGALRRASFFDRETRAGRGWAWPPAVQDSLGELAGRTVGFVGYGEIPRRLAPVLEALGARLLYTATAPKPDAAAEWRALDALLAESDVVSLHLPLTEATEQLIDAAALARMKPGAVLVNTARGGVVDQDALVAALSGGHLAAAGLDVFATEPVAPDDPLLALDNVVLAPHVAWLTTGTLERSLAVAVENCRRLAEGRSLLHRVA